MIKLSRLSLTEDTAVTLRAWQNAIDQLPLYEDRCQEAKKVWGQKRNTQTMTLVSEVLKQMCSGATRCMYCEDSLSDQIEHHRPKSRYPDLTFVWDNLLYACNRCNRPKNNQFAVFDVNNQRIDVHKQPKHIAPPGGLPLLIDPMREDPLNFLMLDLRDRFEFTEIGATELERLRGRYTCEILDLNNSALAESRREAYDHHYKLVLAHYFNASSDAEQVDRCRQALRRSSHPTVWREMVRQWASLPDLTHFAPQPPKALIWWEQVID